VGEYDSVEELLAKIISEIKEMRTVTSLLLIIVVTCLIYVTSIRNIPFADISLLQWIVLLVLIVGIFCFWLYKRRIPRTRNGRIGLIVSIITEDDRDLIKLKQDLIENLKKLLEGRTLRYEFQIICYPDYYSKMVVDFPSALRFVRKSRARFLTFGRGRLRKHNGADVYVLELEGVVIHKVVPEQIQGQLASEFTELFPRKTLIDKNNELFGFEITSQLVGGVAKYIIGISSMISGDIEFSLEMFSSLQTELSSLGNIPSMKKIMNRIPKHLIAIYMLKSDIAYANYNITRDLTYLEEMKGYLDYVQGIDRNNYNVILLRAIYCFFRKDIAGAKREIGVCRRLKINDANWLFSDAFLCAYGGNIEASYSLYLRAFKTGGKTNIVAIESFIENVLIQEPNKYHLHFALGLINRYEKNDLGIAKHHFEKYVRQARPDEFGYAKAKSFLESIEAQLQVASSSEY